MAMINGIFSFNKMINKIICSTKCQKMMENDEKCPSPYL